MAAASVTPDLTDYHRAMLAHVRLEALAALVRHVPATTDGVADAAGAAGMQLISSLTGLLDLV